MSVAIFKAVATELTTRSFGEAAVAPVAASVLSAVLPADEDDDEEDEGERPVAPPPKVTKRKPVVIAKKA